MMLIHWISENVHWIFSGIGVFLLTGIITVVKLWSNRSRTNLKKLTEFYNDSEEFFKDSKFDRAIEVLDESINMLPRRKKREFSKYYKLHGKILNSQKKFSSAVDSLTKALEIDPADGEILHMRGYSHLNTSQYTNAIDDCTMALEFSQIASSYANGGYAYYRLGNLDVALKDYTCIIRLEPHRAHWYYRRADIYRDMGEKQNAISDYKIALEYDPDYYLAKDAKKSLGKLQQLVQ